MQKEKKLNNRAKQFMPFDALKGLKEAYREKERVIVLKKDLSEDQQFELSNNFKLVKKGIIVKIIYFDNGEYVEIEGLVSNVDYVYKNITIVQMTINISDIISLEAQE
jgi:hypothetical protein